MTILNRLGLRPKKPVEVDAPVAHDFFFVRGHPRSGTNWVGALLNLHPQINCFGEFHFEDIRNSIDVLQNLPWQITAREPLKTVMDDCFEDLVRKSMLTLESRKPSARWIGDRTPRGLRIFLEGAPYILIIRDGRDVLVSWTYHVLRMRPHVVDVIVPAENRVAFETAYKKFTADNQHFFKHPHELLADEGWVRFVAGRWANWMKVDKQAMERVESTELDARVMVLRYEELHAQTQKHRREMYEFLGLNPAEAAPISTESKTIAGFEKDDPASFWRHGQVGDWKAYRHDSLSTWFNEVAGDVLVDLKYEKDQNW